MHNSSYLVFHSGCNTSACENSHYSICFGFWTVRKFVVSEHGSVDASVEFVNWAMRCVAATFIFQEKICGSKSVASLCWQYYYSKYHLTPNRKKLSREEYEKLTQETTREGMAGLAASPGFSD
ncbi:hypothetical protein F2Q68_00008681 [Brassica cretica]|uniref:Uncharacterized protein n=1 Tax=Brassica cretica TaxID=69181 RepID=A0A3N6RXU9_BRACR|nr:hypothetical protein F2Q68_00008681 [Brassica cretica]